MPSTASTSSPAPAHAPPPPDERMPLSSVPDLTKFFPPLIQNAICAEMSRGEEGAYYDEFEQLYWMYSGWDEVREDFERVWRPMIDEVQDYLDLRFAARGGGNMELRAELARVEADLLPRATQVHLRRQGPAGIVNTQQNLSMFFSSLLSGTEMRMPSTEQGEVVAARIAPALTDRPALSQQLASLCARVFADESISPEDLIDNLSLKENNNEHASDFAAALDVLLRTKDLPDARRRVALENVWRRVYIQDDWAALRSSAGLKDEQMAAALRNTAFYATLAAARKSRQPQDMLLEPSRSFSSAIPDELAARLPDLPSSTIDALLGDYEQGGRLLNEAMRAGLEACCKECVRLLDEEQEGPSTEEELGGSAVMVE
ncbi:hypothetical protein JCM10049v2_001782 [Rhodotorula toruloides]